MTFRLLVALFVAGGGLLSPAQTKTASDAQVPAEAHESSYVPVQKFDPKRDAGADIRAAIAEAQKTGQRIIVDVGGDWCQYCHQMDQFFQEHPEILEFRERNFITVAVYYGSDKKNEQVLSHYPKVEGIPHFYVLEKDGSVLHSQHLVELRQGAKYSPEKMKDFLTKWSPANAAKSN
jgi:thiol:disulfide interchange protein